MSAISRSCFSLGSHVKPPTFIPNFRKQSSPFDISLYLVANRPSFADEQQFCTKIMQSVAGGVSCVQLRDHASDISQTLKTALHLKNLLQPTGVPLILNTLNLLEVAQVVQPDGLYLEEPLPLSQIRNRWGDAISIGIPAKRMAEILATGHKLHYISVKVFASKGTCLRNDDLWGLQGLQKVIANLPCPIVAIGGIDATIAESIYKQLRPHDGIAMAGGLMRQTDPCTTAQNILTTLQNIRGNL